MKNYISLIIKYRLLVITFVIILSVVAAINLSRGVISSDLAQLFFGENPEYQIYKQRIRQFSNDEVITIAFESPDPLSEQNRKRLKNVIKKVESESGIIKAQAWVNAQRVYVENDELIIEDYATASRQATEPVALLVKELIDDPFFGGLLISRDGKHSAVIIELKPQDKYSAEKGPEFIAFIEKTFTEHGFAAEELHTVGFIVALSGMMSEVRYNLQNILPLISLVLFAMVWILFRRFWPVLITFTVAGISVLWTFSFSVLLDPEINIATVLVPGVILIVTTSDVIHLCSAYLLELDKGLSKEEAILSSGAEVGRACLYTSITTFFGFVSLAFIPAPVMRILGLVYGVGVAAALALAMTLAPILFTIMPQPKAWRREGGGGSHDTIDSIVKFIENLVLRRPWWVIGFFAVYTVVILFGLSKLYIETDLSKRFEPGTKVADDEKYYSEHFAGANMVEAYFESDVKSALTDPQNLRRLSDVQKKIEALPDVDAVFSFIDLIRKIHHEFNPELKGTDALPEDGNLIAQYLLLFEMGGGEDIEQLIDFDRRTMRAAIRVGDGGMRANYEAGARAREMASEILAPDFKVDVTSLTYLTGDWIDNILDGQKRGLLFAISMIAILMMIGLRSISAGAWSMIPNLLPLLTLGGLLGFMYDRTDSDFLGVAMIAIGIGVDDTIHFLMRYKTEYEKTGDVAESLKSTFHFAGRAIILTSIILIFGFMPDSLSDYVTMWMYGTFLPLTLFVALAADLFLLSAMISAGIIKFKPKKS